MRCAACIRAWLRRCRPRRSKRRRIEGRWEGRVNNPWPSLQEWVALYQAAADFKNVAAWDWMYDSDLFGVQNPESGEIGYCCVMGSLGEHYALGVYLGTEGLEGYLQIASGAFDPPDISALHVQKCLMASF